MFFYRGVDIHDEGISGGRLWLDDFTSAFNLLTADEEDDVEASDLPTASANERSAEEGRLDDLLCTFTETQRDFRQQHWYVMTVTHYSIYNYVRHM